LSETDAFKVKAFAAGQWLLWEKPDSTWSWSPTAPPGGSTRLVVRIRTHPAGLFWTSFMESGDPPMAVKMLRGIEERAERAPS
jgi:hypothetical protein